MEHTARTRIHPMMAVAAASVTLVSLVGAASIAGLLPSSHATTSPNDAAVPVAAVSAPAPMVAAAPVPAPEPRRVVEHKTVVHHTYAPPAQVAQTQAPAPAPVAQNSPLGIGIGAVVGGLLGNQVGSGNGRKLATIAGAIGGGYAGNEIAKRNQQQ
ncbi:Glycine zipper 2TM domain-containing protein [Duganella sacchari]|uniref:Glycine zipper 2TM domain-containing protein n=1 Tax=Duganella sacchari TaxID=551987 RepID=A0A1M7Q803_9BURK|nr:glycine zipper 2TM domain-containing protein [Duganella sacchari]SHN26482.1 Glycine zipper 2TM domain-containing protein [Duganella sacchari]